MYKCPNVSYPILLEIFCSNIISSSVSVAYAFKLLLQEMQSVIEQGFVQREISLYKKDGTEIPFLLTSVKVETKTQTYIMGVGADITDRKKTVNALVESEVRLKELNATKEKLYSVIAHDLRSPFGVILGFTDLIKNIALIFIYIFIQIFIFKIALHSNTYASSLLRVIVNL